MKPMPITAANASNLMRLATFKGHTAPVWEVAFSPDGHTLVSCSSDRTLRVWEVATGNQLAQLEVESGGRIWAVAYSPDGRTIASAHEDGMARLWDTLTWDLRATLLHEGEVRGVAFSPDSQLVASCSIDATVRVWDVVSGAERMVLRGHDGMVWQVRFRPGIGGRRKWLLASGAKDGVRVWRVADGTLYAQFDHPDVHSLSFSPDGALLISTGADKTARLWDVERKRTTGRTFHLPHLNETIFGPDGSLLVYTSVQTFRNLGVIDRKSLEPLFVPTAITANRGAFSPGGSVMAVAGSNTISLFGLGTAQTEFKGVSELDVSAVNALQVHEVAILRGHAGVVNAVAVSPDGSVVASGSDDGTLRVWDADSGEERVRLTGHTGAVTAVAFSPDGKTLASGSGDLDQESGAFGILWDVKTGRRKANLLGLKARVTGLAFNPDGKTLVSIDFGGALNLWDADSGEHVIRIDLLRGSSMGNVAYSPDGRTIAVASGSETSVDGVNAVRLYDSRSLAGIAVLEQNNWVTQVAFGPDGKTLAGLDASGYMSVWEMPVRHLYGEGSAISAVTFSPDGSLFVLANHDHTIRLLNSKSGKEYIRLEGHTDRIVALAFSTDGKILASCSADQTVRLWGI